MLKLTIRQSNGDQQEIGVKAEGTVLDLKLAIKDTHQLDVDG
jgi:hypothetical protein